MSSNLKTDDPPAIAAVELSKFLLVNNSLDRWFEATWTKGTLERFNDAICMQIDFILFVHKYASENPGRLEKNRNQYQRLSFNLVWHLTVETKTE